MSLLPLTIFLHLPHLVSDVFPFKYPISASLFYVLCDASIFSPAPYPSAHTLPLGAALCVAPGRPSRFFRFSSLSLSLSPSGVFVGRIVRLFLSVFFFFLTEFIECRIIISWPIIGLLHKTDPSSIPFSVSETSCRLVVFLQAPLSLSRLRPQSTSIH